MKAGYNGAYVYNGNSKNTYYYDNTEGAFIVHKYDDVLYYYNKRVGSKYQKEFVAQDKKCELERRYRYSKHNPAFHNTIVTVRSVKTGVVFDHYIVIYKWSDTPTKEFIVPRHGNTKKPSTSSYYREGIRVYENIDSMLFEGKSNDAIYAVLTSCNPETAGETIRDPKVISNRQYERQKQAVTENEEEKKSTEAELMIEYLRGRVCESC